MSKAQQPNTKYFKIDYDSESSSYKVYVRAVYEDKETSMPSYKTKWCEVSTSLEKLISDADTALNVQEKI